MSPQQETTPRARRGASPGMHRQLPWRDDPVVLTRLEHVAALRAAGLQTGQIAERLGISRDTVQDDYGRLGEMAAGAALGSILESVEKLRLIYRQALAAFAATP